MTNCASCSEENQIVHGNSGNKEGVFTETSRIIGTPQNPYPENPIVDIATLEMDGPLITSNPSYKISLQLIPIYYSDFRTLFFKSNTDFEPNPGAFQNISGIYMKMVGFKDQIKLNDTGRQDGSLNIYKEVVTHYEQDLGLPKNCWSSCSLNAINRFLGGQESLFDVGGACKVACSLTLDQLFTAWEQQGVELSGNFSDSNSVRVPTDTTLTPIAVVTARYKSITPGVSDMEIFFPYAVDFNGIINRYQPNGISNILPGEKFSASVIQINFKSDTYAPPNAGESITVTLNVEFDSNVKIKNGGTVNVEKTVNDGTGNTVDIELSYSGNDEFKTTYEFTLEVAQVAGATIDFNINNATITASIIQELSFTPNEATKQQVTVSSLAVDNDNRRKSDGIAQYSEPGLRQA